MRDYIQEFAALLGQQPDEQTMGRDGAPTEAVFLVDLVGEHLRVSVVPKPERREVWVCIQTGRHAIGSAGAADPEPAFLAACAELCAHARRDAAAASKVAERWGLAEACP